MTGVCIATFSIEDGVPELSILRLLDQYGRRVPRLAASRAVRRTRGR